MREAVARARCEFAAARFGLLVIPVDFADYRLPADWDPNAALGQRLFPLAGESLANFYRIASGERLELTTLLAPRVSLAGVRRDYADPLFGLDYENSRRLAREALQAVAAMGLDFRQLDMEGPDRLPGSADDDGEVDGVLILHAAPGTENDPPPGGGLIEALQYFLDEPVANGGVVASSYAVASLQSGLGIWAHEVGHLFGLNDRYDTDMSADQGEAVARGGLGIFSLMAAGAWGNGDGSGAALLDAYSAAQLGWCDIVSARGSGRPDTLLAAPAGRTAWRVWTQGISGPEYFLLETRAGPASGPFDAQLPPGQLLIYHVDESLAEGEAEGTSFPDRHIRVVLVEADGDGHLAIGEDTGRPADLFPGPLGKTEFSPTSDPASLGYDGPSEVSLTGINPLGDKVALEISDTVSFGVSVDFGFAGEAPGELQLVVTETGLPLPFLTATVSVASEPAWGEFTPGGQQVILDLVRDENGRWTTPDPPLWSPYLMPPDSEAFTVFSIELSSDGWQAEPAARLWLWQQPTDPLDFAANWDTSWEMLHPSGQANTTWHFWAGPPFLTADGSGVLVCTGAEFPSAFPGWNTTVAYHDSADVVLVSSPLAPGTEAVRLVHAVDLETERPGLGWDGAVIEFGLPDGSWAVTQPVDGYDAQVDARSDCPLHGRDAFCGHDPLSADGPVTWRVDLFPVPEACGPFKLRLRFASDKYPLSQPGKGWFVARLESLASLDHDSAFPVDLLAPDNPTASCLVWAWPWEPTDSFAIETSADQGLTWTEIWSGPPAPGPGGWQWSLPLASLAGGLPADPSVRQQVRVVALVSLGRVVSRPMVLYRDGGLSRPALLGSPYPNPARGPVRLLVKLPYGEAGRLSVFDVRGRRLRGWDLAGGQQLLLWDGRDGAGRRAAAGQYLFRLETGGRRVTRKVVFLP